MRRRYKIVSRSRTRSNDEEFYDIDRTPTNFDTLNPTVYCLDEPYEEDTGLIDQYGSPIKAMIEPEPIGFLHFDIYDEP